MILQVNDYPHPASQVNQSLNNQNNNQTNSSFAHCPDSLARWYCLNGATCFQIFVEESILYNCLCRHGFHGARCDFKYTASSSRSNSSTGEDEIGHRLEFMGATGDRMAALGLSGGDDLLLQAHNQNVTASGQSGQQSIESLTDQVRSSVLALVCCLILILVMAMCALLTRRFFRKQTLEQRSRQRQASRVSRAILSRLTLSQAKAGNRSVSSHRAPAGLKAERQVADEQQVTSKWDDTLRVERNLQSDYFREHAIELARQATHSNTCDWEQRPAVAAIHQAAGVSGLFVQQPPVMTTQKTTKSEAQSQQQQVAKGRVIRWPAGDNIGQAARLA